MRALGVVVPDPLRDHTLCMTERFKEVLPDALLLEASDEALDQTILLGRVRRDELLPQTIRKLPCCPAKKCHPSTDLFR